MAFAIVAAYGVPGRPREGSGVGVAIPDPPAARHAVEYAKRVNPRIEVVARTHNETDGTQLLDLGARQAVLGERELAIQLARFTLRRFGVSAPKTEAIAQGLRGRG